MHNTREGRANLLQEMPGNSQEPTGPSKPRPHYPAAQQPGWVGGKTQGKLCRQDCSVTKPTVHRLSCSTQLEHAHIQCTLYGGVGVERGPVFCQTQPNREHQHTPVQQAYNQGGRVGQTLLQRDLTQSSSSQPTLGRAGGKTKTTGCTSRLLAAQRGQPNQDRTAGQLLTRNYTQGARARDREGRCRV